MLVPTKAPPIKIKIHYGKNHHFYKVPEEIAKKLVASLKKYKEKEISLPWQEVLKDDINAAGEEPAYFVRAARKGAGMTQTRLAEKLRMPQSNLSQIERGRRPVGKTLAKRLEKIFNVDYRVFL